MTTDDIIQALDWHKPSVDVGPQSLLRRIQALVAQAEADEREACAAICDTTPPHPFRPSIEAAHAIRARGIK